MRPISRRICAGAGVAFFALTLAYTGAANATVWVTGDLTTYDQGGWDSNPNSILTNHYSAVYGGGSLIIGGNFGLAFSNASAVLAYLPASGTARPLTASLQDPTDSASGVFGGDVLALQLDIDFSDAGFLSGTSGIHFGDLILENFSTIPGLNGLTVRQFATIINALLGDGSSGGFTTGDITALDPIVQDVASAFEGGTPSGFAQTNLVAPAAFASQVPEPSSLLLLASGLLGVAVRYNRKRRTSPRLASRREEPAL
jgi:PEP-CTERM motif